MSFENVGQGKFSFLAKPHVLRNEVEYDISIAEIDTLLDADLQLAIDWVKNWAGSR